MKVYIICSPYLTAEGLFRYEFISLDEAKRLVQENEIVSTVGNEPTANLLTKILGVEVPANRMVFPQQKVDQKFLVYSIFGNVPEDDIFNEKEILNINVEFKLITRIE